MTRRKLLRVVVPLAAALVVTLIVARLSARPSAPTIPLLVAKSTVPKGSVLQAAQLQVERVPKSLQLQGSLQSVQQATGEVARVTLTTGAPVLSDEIVPSHQAGLAYAIPPGHRAMSIAVNGVSGVSGNLSPGAEVDVLATFAYQSGKGGVPNSPRSTVVVQDVSVLATGSSGVATGGKSYALVTLAVTPEEAATVGLAQQEGTIVLLLRPPVGAGSGSASVTNGGLGQ